jgi:hypothetical protein
MITNWTDVLFSPNALVEVVVYNPAWDTTKWSEYPNLSFIRLLYRRVGDVEWRSALDQTFNRIFFSQTVPAVCSLFI